jgi:hypothetical protein
VHAWTSGLSQTINTQTTNLNKKSRNEGRKSEHWIQSTNRSQSQQAATESSLLHDEVEEHEVKESQFVTDNMISQPLQELGLTHRHQTDTLSEDPNSPMNRFTRTRYILAERHKKMQENLSSSLATLFYAQRWKRRSLRKQTAKKNILTGVYSASLPEEKEWQSSNSEMQNGLFTDDNQSMNKQDFSIQSNPVPKLHAKENGQSSTSRFPSSCTRNSSGSSAVRFTSFKLQTSHPALLQLDELSGSPDDGNEHNPSSITSQFSLASGKR